MALINFLKIAIKKNKQKKTVNRYIYSLDGNQNFKKASFVIILYSYFCISH